MLVMRLVKEFNYKLGVKLIIGMIESGEIRCGTRSQEAPPDILEAPHNGGESKGILGDFIEWRIRGDTG